MPSRFPARLLLVGRHEAADRGDRLGPLRLHAPAPGRQRARLRRPRHLQRVLAQADLQSADRPDRDRAAGDLPGPRLQGRDDVAGQQGRAAGRLHQEGAGRPHQPQERRVVDDDRGRDCSCWCSSSSTSSSSSSELVPDRPAAPSPRPLPDRGGGLPESALGDRSTSSGRCWSGCTCGTASRAPSSRSASITGATPGASLRSASCSRS